MSRAARRGATVPHLLVTACLASAGCGGDPQPAPEERPPTATAETPATPTPPPTRDVVITGKPKFPAAVMELQPGDLIEATLTKGGRARGRVEALKPEIMTLAAEGTSVLTRLTPPEVEQVRLVYRPPPLTFLDGSEQPRDLRESWLPRFAGRAALDGVPEDQWRERFKDNIPLVVKAALELPVWTATGRMGDKVLLSQAPACALAPQDQLKLVATMSAAARKGQIAGADLGRAQVWLHKRGLTVTRLITTQGLPTAVVEREQLDRLLEKDPGTFLASHPGTPPDVIKIARSPAQALLAWKKRLESLPDRAGMRRLRAQQPKQVEAAERDVRQVFAQLGAEAAAELGRPLVIELVLPQVQDGQLLIVSWSRELGLD